MIEPVVFLSAASVDLSDWRNHLHRAFSRAGFRVLTQEQSLWSPTGDVKKLLSESIAESDCVIHLAGFGYGSHAQTPFPASPNFKCSWTQFEYYYAHELGKEVIAFVCSPAFSKQNFIELGNDGDLALKKQLQSAHRERVSSGRFIGTPLEAKKHRTCNEKVESLQQLVEAVASAVGTLKRLDKEARERAKGELQELVEAVSRMEYGIKKMGDKVNSGARRMTIFLFAFLCFSALLGYGLQQILEKTKDVPKLVEMSNDPHYLGAKIRTHILVRADKEITEQEKIDNDPVKLKSIRDKRDASLAMVETIVDTITRGLKISQNKVLSEALQMLVDGSSLEDVERYLTNESQRVWREIEKAEKIKSDGLEVVKSFLSQELLRANLIQGRGALDDAQKLYERVVQVAPEWSEVHFQAASFFLSRGMFKDALDAAKMADKTAHSNAERIKSLYILAFIAEATGDRRGAENLATQVIQLAPTAPDIDTVIVAGAYSMRALFVLGEEELTRQREDQVLSDLDNAKNLSSGLDGARAEIAMVFAQNSTLNLYFRGGIKGDDAMKRMNEYVFFQKKLNGENNGNIAMTYNNIAAILFKEKDFDGAASILEKSLKISKNWYGDVHPNVSHALGMLSHVMASKENYLQAANTLQQAVEIDEKIYGKDDVRLASDLDELAALWTVMKNFKNALNFSRRAVFLHFKYIGETHQVSKDAVMVLHGFVGDCRNNNVSEENFRQEIEVLRGVTGLGKDIADELVAKAIEY